MKCSVMLCINTWHEVTKGVPKLSIVYLQSALFLKLLQKLRFCAETIFKLICIKKYHITGSRQKVER